LVLEFLFYNKLVSKLRFTTQAFEFVLFRDFAAWVVDIIIGRTFSAEA